jgi:hypothetical protein
MPLNQQSVHQTTVVGIDGQSPSYEPTGVWHIWALHEIWQGPTQEGGHKWVPKVLDYVVDVETYTTYIVDHLDPVTLAPTLREIRPSNSMYIFTETDVLFGVGVGSNKETYRLYIDKSITPWTCQVDGRLHIFGSMSSYAKVFKGSIISNTGKVISKIYDNTGNFVSESVSLEDCQPNSHNQNGSTEKIISVFNTTEALVDGEIVTAVIYADDGHVVTKQQLLVENTSYIKDVNAHQKYITHISVDCPFMSNTDDHLIEFPLNIPMNAMNLMGTVHYSDGSKLTLPVNGIKFTMFGIDQLVSSIIGQKVDLVLRYALSKDETSYAGVGVDAKYVTEPYSIKIVNPNYSYAVKLFGWPNWVNETQGYVIDWWLYSLDRNIYINVTPLVNFDDVTGPYDPILYGYTQRKQISLNLKDVSVAYKPFVHTQFIEIALMSIPDNSRQPYMINTDATPGKAMYGSTGAVAKLVDQRTVNISLGLTLRDDWLMKLYYDASPLIDPSREITAPVPTHFVIFYNNEEHTVPIANFDKDIEFDSNLDPFKNIYIRFVKETSTGQLELSIVALQLQTDPTLYHKNVI